LEEILVAYEEDQEKGGTFTYRYLLLPFTMLNWTPLAGRLLAPADKGFLEKLLEPLHSREDPSPSTK
jgi:hypothetical protein